MNFLEVKISNNESSKNKYTGKKPARQAYISNFAKEFSRYCPTDQRTLYLIWICNIYFPKTKLTQETIGAFSGVNRLAGHKSVHRNKSRRLLFTDRPAHNVYATLHYRVAYKFFSPHTQFELMPYFASLGLTPSAVFDFFADRRAERRKKKYDNLLIAKHTQNEYSGFYLKKPDKSIRSDIIENPRKGKEDSKDSNISNVNDNNCVQDVLRCLQVSRNPSYQRKSSDIDHLSSTKYMSDMIKQLGGG